MVSERAKAAVEAAEGSVKTIHYNELGLRFLLTPEWSEKNGRMLPKSPRPAPRLCARVDGTGQIPAPTSVSPAPEPVASTPVVPA
jgi:large subunit ribosomal protein L15